MRRRVKLALLGLALTQAMLACSEHRTSGWYELHAAGAQQADLRGPAKALTQWEAGGYWITFDLTQQESPLRTQEYLSLVFEGKPDPGSRPLETHLEPSIDGRHLRHVSFGYGGCAVPRWDADTTVPSYWKVDSGRVHIISPRDQQGVTGSFNVFTHLVGCRPGDTLAGPDAGRRMVMKGVFQTHAPPRRSISEYVKGVLAG